MKDYKEAWISAETRADKFRYKFETAVDRIIVLEEAVRIGLEQLEGLKTRHGWINCAILEKALLKNN